MYIAVVVFERSEGALPSLSSPFPSRPYASSPALLLTVSVPDLFYTKSIIRLKTTSLVGLTTQIANVTVADATVTDANVVFVPTPPMLLISLMLPQPLLVKLTINAAAAAAALAC